MPKPTDIITTVAVLMNDAAQNLYTNVACLPYLNLALDILQETYEHNDIPVTHHATPKVITIPTGIGLVGFDTVPALPSDLIEFIQLWESASGLNDWTPIIKRDFLPHYLEDGTTISQFLIWTLDKGRVKLIPANQNIDLKIDYTCSIFNTPILIADIKINLPFTNIKTYLEFETAALCALFIAENESRAQALDSLAGTALNRALGIPIKGMQSVVTRRRPFRHSFKHRGLSY